MVYEIRFRSRARALGTSSGQIARSFERKKTDARLTRFIKNTAVLMSVAIINTALRPL